MRLAVPFLVHLMYPIICCEKYKQQFILILSVPGEQPDRVRLQMFWFDFWSCDTVLKHVWVTCSRGRRQQLTPPVTLGIPSRAGTGKQMMTPWLVPTHSRP